MRICQVTSVHPRYDTRVFQKIAKSVAESEFESYLLVCDKLGDEIKDNVHFVAVDFVPKNRVERILLSWKKLYKKALEIDADIYQLHDPELLKLGLKLKKKGKKVIFDSHEDYAASVYEKTWIPAFCRNIIGKLYVKKECRTLKKFDGLVSVTPHIVDRLKSINNNTIMITNYPRLAPPIEHNADGLVLCFAGGISEQWKHENIIKSLEKFHGKVKYILIGNDDSSYFESLKNLDGFKYVEATGKLPYDKVLENYKRANIGVALNGYVANVNYHMGSLGNNKLFELMMANMPVICTDFDLWKPIVENNHAGICINPNSVEELEKAIQYFIDNPKEIELMGKNGRKLSEEEYNWHSQEIKLLDFYRHI